MHSAYEAVLSRIKTDLKDSYLWISFDETTDSLGRYIANLIVGKLDPESPSKPHLIYTKELSRTNQETVAHFVNNGLKILNPDESKVLLAVTDAASYMAPAMRTLKVFFPSLVHVTCLAHGLNRVAEQIRIEYPEVNKLISCVKKVFVKAPLRVQTFRQTFPNICLPPEPVLTRWGTWLAAVDYYNDYFIEVKRFINNLEDNSIYVIDAKKVLNDSKVQFNLAYISAHFTFIKNVISNFEGNSKPLNEKVEYLQDAINKISLAPGLVGQKVKKKLESVIQKNTGLKSLFVAASLLTGKDDLNDSEFPVHLMKYLKYCPVSSVDVERSFSAFKLILTDKRHNFTIENLEKILVIYCESNYGINA